MSDFERARAGAADEDRLPWLEPVEDEEAASGPGAGKLIAAVIIALAIIGCVVGGIFALTRRAPPAGSGDLIAAPEGNYKVKPDNPGGMKIEGEGDTSFAASNGKETNASIDLSAIPETPVAGAGSMTSADAATNSAVPKPAAPPAKTAAATPGFSKAVPTTNATSKSVPEKPVATAKVTPAKPATEKAKPAPVATASAAGGTANIQLGAFSSEAKAQAAWTTLSGRYGFLAPFARQVIPVQAGGGTLYRLRAAAGGQAATVCAKLKVAGETCAVVG